MCNKFDIHQLLVCFLMQHQVPLSISIFSFNLHLEISSATMEEKRKMKIIFPSACDKLSATIIFTLNHLRLSQRFHKAIFSSAASNSFLWLDENCLKKLTVTYFSLFHIFFFINLLFCKFTINNTLKAIVRSCCLFCFVVKYLHAQEFSFFHSFSSTLSRA